jgi:flagellar basal body-associated protein FliL
MKKEKFTFLILFVEIAAIVFLHFSKSHQAEGKMISAKKAAVNSTYQLKALSFTKIR